VTFDFPPSNSTFTIGKHFKRIENLIDPTGLTAKKPKNPRWRLKLKKKLSHHFEFLEKLLFHKIRILHAPN
jgi:hypothetical protein